MKNPKAKGRRNEVKTKKYLEERGWLCELVRGSSKFSKSVDFFGLFDLIALKEGIVMFVQVKSNRKPKLRPFKEFKEKYFVPIYIFVWKDYAKAPLIIEIKNGNKQNISR